MIDVRTLAVLSFATIGCVFVLLAAVGVLRMPDLFSRMQASSKAATLGTLCTMTALVIHFGTLAVIIRVVVLAVFLLLTVPIAAHLIARAGYRSGAELEQGAVIDDAAEQHYLRDPGDSAGADDGEDRKAGQK